MDNIEEIEKQESAKRNDPIEALLRRLKLPAKYWFPTLISVIIGTASLIWFAFSVINPLENDILRLQNAYTTNGHPSISSTIILKNSNGKKFSKKQTIALKNIEYELKKRDDLILLIIGYTNDNLYKLQSEKVKISHDHAKNVYKKFTSFGIESERIFYKGYGHEVPKSLPKEYESNVAIILVDLYFFMDLAVRGNILSVI